MPKVHFRIPIMEDGILDNLSDIERDVLKDGIIKQGSFGCTSHTFDVEMRREVMK